MNGSWDLSGKANGVISAFSRMAYDFERERRRIRYVTEPAMTKRQTNPTMPPAIGAVVRLLLDVEWFVATELEGKDLKQRQIRSWIAIDN